MCSKDTSLRRKAASTLGKILKLKFIYTQWDSIVHVDHTCIVASFPGSPRVQTNNQRKGEPGKIYPMRNVTDRDNLIICVQGECRTLWGERE